MYIVMWIALIILGFISPKSKIVPYFQMIFLILKMGFVTGTADYRTYNDIYVSLITGKSSVFSGIWLFNSFYYIFGRFTSYQFVVFTTALIGMLLLYKSINYYTNKVAMVLSLYMLAPFTIDATQQRNFLAMCVWLVFSRYLYLAYIYKDERRKNIEYYLVGVFLASSIHTSFWVTILFLIIIWLRDKKLFLTAILFVILTAVGFFNVFDIIIDWISQYNNVIAKGIYAKYVAYAISFDSDSAMLRIELSILFLIIFLCILAYLKYIKRYSVKISYIRELNVAFLFIVPLMFFSMEFYRIQRNILILDYCILATSIKENFSIKRGLIKDFFIVLGVVGIAIFYLYIDSIVWNYESVFKPLLF